MTFLELEKKCKKRRLLRNIKILLLIVIMSGIAYVSYSLFFKDETIKKIDSVKKEKVKEINASKNKEIVFLNKEIILNKKENIKEPPSLRFYIPYNNEAKKVTKNKKNLSYKKNVENKDKKSVQNKEKKRIENKEANFIIKTTVLPSFETCILLANKYYKEGNYKEALKWAKNANIQNNKKAISWILSAKILNKMGKKEEARKILKLYYNYSKDEKVKKLMEQLNE